MSYRDLEQRLQRGDVILLDGGTGSEVLRLRLPSTVGLWAVSPLLNAPDVLREIHETYIAAGADIITTATFRTHRRALLHAGLDHDAAELTCRAVALAEEARLRSERGVLIAGSMAPLEDCYEPDRVPDDAELQAEHEAHARILGEAGVNFLLAETMNTVREARAALLAGLQTGLPTWISLTCTGGGRLLSGETIKAALDALLPLAPSALLVNCTAPDHVTTALAAMQGLHTVPLGAYANNGHPTGTTGWAFTGDYPPARYVEEARRWRGHGARILGGCCGTTPEHIRALREDLDRSAA
ncbi:MAG: homocysteine S-methyltransferase family protein [Acidobacteriota bacterium]|jgi:S-methylmethionine-dependent homocysteine/selenocysteine methylase